MSFAAEAQKTTVQLKAEAELELRRRRGDACGGGGKQLSPKQRAAVESEAFETLYGGAAGGGKTFLLTWLARFGAHRRALLLRRTYPMLEDSLILESKNLYGDPRYYNSSRHVWELPGKAGRRIRLGHCKDDASVFGYQSAEFDFLGVDEGSQFTEFQYLYLLSRLRSTRVGQRVRAIVCSNPGGEGHRWIKRRWAAWLDKRHPNPAKPGELRWYKQLPEGEEVETTADDPLGRSRTFIPALLGDNLHLPADYIATLNLLPEPYRTQLIAGDWAIGEEDGAFQLFPTDWVEEAMARWKANGGEEFPLMSIGVDVARGGPAETVLVGNRGEWFSMPLRFPGVLTKSGAKVGALIVGMRESWTVVGLDILGVGSAVEDVLKENEIPYEPINFAVSSNERDRSGRLKMVNVRAAAYWKLREALDPKNQTGIQLPPDPKLRAELLEIKWELALRGVKIEEKDDIAKRLKRSPDSADALVNAYWTSYGRSIPFVETGGRREMVEKLREY